MQQTHSKTSSEKCLLCHKCIVLYTLHRKVRTASIIFFLQKNVGNPSYDPCLLLLTSQHSSRSASQISVQAAWWNGKQAGSWAGGLGQVAPLLWTFASFSEGTRVLCGFFNCPEGHEGHRASGHPGKSIFISFPQGTSEHLPFLPVSSPAIWPLHEVRRLFRKGSTS